MSILKILQYPDLRLRRISTDVTDTQAPQIQAVINNMLETLKHTKHCAALAATQLDIDQPPSIIVINPLDEDEENKKSEKNNKILCLINPKIIAASGEELEEEGCMSIPDARAKIKRATKVTVTALNTQGKPIKLEVEDFYARCLQHECDHLKGILYIDYLSKLKRNIIEKKIKKFSSN